MILLPLPPSAGMIGKDHPSVLPLNGFQSLLSHELNEQKRLIPFPLYFHCQELLIIGALIRKGINIPQTAQQHE